MVVGVSSENRCIDREEDQYFHVTKIPEYGLLAAILEISRRDLGPEADVHDRQAAIRWFRDDPMLPGELDKEDARFTYEQIVEYLDLGPAELQILEVQVKAGVDFEQSRQRDVSDEHARKLQIADSH